MIEVRELVIKATVAKREAANNKPLKSSQLKIQDVLKALDKKKER